MDLKDALRQIQTDGANLTHGRLPRVVFNTSTLAHQGRWGASTPSRPVLLTNLMARLILDHACVDGSAPSKEVGDDL